VPTHPELTRLLRNHLAKFGTAPDGRLFGGVRGGELPTITYRPRKYCQSRVPASFRNQIRIAAAIRGSSVSMCECHPPWHPDLTEWSKVRVAQLRYSADTLAGEAARE
jgi:hypothetical protein